MALSGLAAVLLVAAGFARAGGRLAGSWIGVLAVGAIVALGLQIGAPTIAYVVAWPLLAAAACAALTAGATGGRPLAWAASLILIAATLAWLGGIFHSALQGLDLPELAALPVWLGAMAIWPLAWPQSPRWRESLAPGAAVLALGLAVMAVIHFTSPWSPRYPRAVAALCGRC
jgi:hypothetical protein